uniref:ATP-dependent DNA helicase n=1 Tax=Lepisosteus oculatus TaxID=7918 RepID=W5M5U5_LEPOC
LKDILNENRVLKGEGITFLTGGFRQTLPVIPKGTRADELKASIKAYLWKHVQKLHLQTNMRVHVKKGKHAGIPKHLLRIGDGTFATEKDGSINLPKHVTDSSKEALESVVFPNLAANYENTNWLIERAILAPKNDAVDDINEKKSNVFKNVGTVFNTDDVVQYPVEFLNILHLPGVPPHNLSLKIGCPVILSRYLDPLKLCYGTRLVIKKLHPYVLEASILSGTFKGEDVFIPRIIIPSDLPFRFKRLQFPIRLSFAMSINKA